MWAFHDSNIKSVSSLVLIHGYPFTGAMWQPQVDALSSARRVIVPDLPGFGRTPLASEVTTMESMAEGLRTLLDHLSIEKAIFCGFSMGGYALLEFVRLFPERTQGLILADTKATADSDEAKKTRETQARLILEKGMAAIAEDFLKKLFTQQTLQSPLKDARPHTPRASVEKIRNLILSCAPVSAAAALRGMAQRRDQTPHLASIRVPTLILVGDEDPITTPADAKAMQEKIPDAKLTVIKNAAHLSNLENLEAFNQAVDTFIQAIGA